MFEFGTHDESTELTIVITDAVDNKIRLWKV